MAEMTKRCNNARNSARTTANCAALSLRLKQVEFAITDVALYLDAYPNCSQALAYYHRLIDERTTLMEAINTQCGPVTIMENLSQESWQWIGGPWPWMIDAN